ncbi:MAG: AAA family ATPase [Proteobacteria bacterium]|nr:AAA family ATPase [Pseudomonadota bacterium]
MDRVSKALTHLDIEHARVDPGSLGVDSAAAIVRADPGGELLASLVPADGLPSVQAVRFASGIAKFLQQLHSGRFVHREVHPQAFLATRDGDLHPLVVEQASRIPRETSPTVHPEGLTGNLAYVSPEQTGRMNRAIDWRTDLYSLGATLYHLLTGRPPFATDDAVEMVHAHIAKAPKAPREVRSKVEDALSDITLRLLAKNAEDRYQSAAGVADDLATCLRRLENYGEIGELELGSTDRSDQLRIPDKLYGRERDLRALMEAWTRIADRTSELLLVAGYSGVGKSALVHELHRRIVEKRGYFVAGKQDQFRRGLPYHLDRRGVLRPEPPAAHREHRPRRRLASPAGDRAGREPPCPRRSRAPPPPPRRRRPGAHAAAPVRVRSPVQHRHGAVRRSLRQGASPRPVPGRSAVGRRRIAEADPTPPGGR